MHLDGSIPFTAGLVWFAVIFAVSAIGVRRYGVHPKPEYLNDPYDVGYVYPFMNEARKFTPEGLQWYTAQKRYYSRAFILIVSAWVILDLLL